MKYKPRDRFFFVSLQPETNFTMPENNTTNSGPRRQRRTQVPVDNTFGHLQPQALDVEKAVLGALMIDKDAYSVVCEILYPESFYEPRNQKVYAAIRDLAMAEKPVDIVTVTDQLSKSGTLEDVGGPVYIAELSGRVASSANVEYHAHIIAQKFLARQLIQYASDLETKAFDETIDIDELMQHAEGALFELSQKNMKKDYTQIDPVVTQAVKVIQEAAKNKDGMTGIPTGYHGLDDKTSGWQESDLVIIAGRPAMGKTAFALSMAKNIACDYQVPIAFFSLEMTNQQLVNRLHDTPGLSVFELRTKARRLVREHDVKIIMIDYLQLMNANGMRFSSRQEEVSTISRSLKGLAKELNIPIIALSQLNRGVESREGLEGKRPQLSDLRESGAIEQDADMVLFVHRPEYYHIYMDDNGRDLHGMAQIIIAKHRKGATGDVLLNFRGEFTRFENPDDSSLSRSKKSDSGGEIIGSKINGEQDGGAQPFIPGQSNPFAGTPLPEPGDGPLPF